MLVRVDGNNPFSKTERINDLRDVAADRKDPRRVGDVESAATGVGDGTGVPEAGGKSGKGGHRNHNNACMASLPNRRRTLSHVRLSQRFPVTHFLD